MEKLAKKKGQRGRSPRKTNVSMIKKDSRKLLSTKRSKVKRSILKKTRSSSSKSVMKHDPNCWKCREANTDLHCTKCALSYHHLCIHMAPEELTENWQCPSCRQIEEAKQYWTIRGLDRLLLSLVVKRLYYDPQFKVLRNTTGIFPQLTGILDLNHVHQKVKKKLYYVPEEILFDIKNIRHKCLIYLPENASQVSKADELLAACIKEINNIKACSECYGNRCKNSKDWMIHACERPHLLVWAKVEFYPYWPAKVLSYSDKYVSVEFFDDHSTAEVKVGNCLLYSKEYPIDGTRPASISAAVMESRKHVENLKIKFGTFEYASQRIPLDTKRFDQQLHQSVPKWSTGGRKTSATNAPIQQTTKTTQLRRTEPKISMISKTIRKSPKPLASSSVTVPKKMSWTPVNVTKPFERIETAPAYEEEETFQLISDESDDEDPLQLSANILE